MSFQFGFAQESGLAHDRCLARQPPCLEREQHVWNTQLDDEVSIRTKGPHSYNYKYTLKIAA